MIINEEVQRTCKHIECEKAVNSRFKFCDYHLKKGLFGSGESYDQYHIIEKDFIEFIEIIPLSIERNMRVYSPVLRDIILRCCIQIEVFFKEWTKYYCFHKEFKRLKTLYTTKGAKAWNFGDYFIFNELKLLKSNVHVRTLDVEINPFENWESTKHPPEWWKVYNAIKHEGIDAKDKVTLSLTLEALAALFVLHCSNKITAQYLEKFSNLKIVPSFSRPLSRVHKDDITSPLDSKRYLFKLHSSLNNANVEFDLLIHTDID